MNLLNDNSGTLYAERVCTSRSLDAQCDVAVECVRDLMRQHGNDIEVTDWQHDRERGVVWATAVVAIGGEGT